MNNKTTKSKGLPSVILVADKFIGSMLSFMIYLGRFRCSMKRLLPTIFFAIFLASLMAAETS